MPYEYLRAKVALLPHSLPPRGTRAVWLRLENATGDSPAGLEPRAFTAWPRAQRNHVIGKPAKDHHAAEPNKKAACESSGVGTGLPNPPPYFIPIEAHAWDAEPSQPTEIGTGPAPTRQEEKAGCGSSCQSNAVPTPHPPALTLVAMPTACAESGPQTAEDDMLAVRVGMGREGVQSVIKGEPKILGSEVTPRSENNSFFGLYPLQVPADPANGATPATVTTVCSEVPFLKETGSLISEVHPIPAQSARQDAVPEATSFTAVKQENQHFVDKLHQAITSHAGLENHEKKFMFHLMALENARQNTISEMLEMAGKIKQRSKTQAVAEAFIAIVKPDEKHLATMVQKVVKSRKCLSVSLAFVSYLVAVTNQNVWITFSQQADLENFCSGNMVKAGERNKVCLIGIPYYNIKDFIPFGIEEAKVSCCGIGETMADIIWQLNTSLERLPQELSWDLPEYHIGVLWSPLDPSTIMVPPASSVAEMEVIYFSKKLHRLASPTGKVDPLIRVVEEVPSFPYPFHKCYTAGHILWRCCGLMSLIREKVG
ncbi:hypothetical protein WISP_03277 [Willisornis vidua]|uniref:Uncharacterized protein n=1 Tax=Willisornis vidua TaxID=1566151 RepID=A0ABQ9DZG7_9PASS|nr:hypothetical protein WISP_03277 [Willisornis vidua]